MSERIPQALAGRLMVLVGQKKVLAMAVKGKLVRHRWSKLKEWLESPRYPGATP